MCCKPKLMFALRAENIFFEKLTWILATCCTTRTNVKVPGVLRLAENDSFLNLHKH